MSEHRPRKDVAESLGTALGILVLAMLLAAAVVWWEGIF